MAVTLALAKRYLRVGHDDDDALLQVILNAVTEKVEALTRRKFESDAFTHWCDGGGVHLWVPWGPLISVSEVYDDDGDEALATTAYEIRGDRRIVLKGGGRWDGGAHRYKVTYTAGHTLANPVPPGLDLAMLGFMARSYRNRGGAANESAAGWAIGWMNDQQADMLADLEPFILKP